MILAKSVEDGLKFHALPRSIGAMRVDYRIRKVMVKATTLKEAKWSLMRQKPRRPAVITFEEVKQVHFENMVEVVWHYRGPRELRR